MLGCCILCAHTGILGANSSQRPYGQLDLMNMWESSVLSDRCFPRGSSQCPGREQTIGEGTAWLWCGSGFGTQAHTSATWCLPPSATAAYPQAQHSPGISRPVTHLQCPNGCRSTAKSANANTFTIHAPQGLCPWCGCHSIHQKEEKTPKICFKKIRDSANSLQKNTLEFWSFVFWGVVFCLFGAFFGCLVFLVCLLIFIPPPLNCLIFCIPVTYTSNLMSFIPKTHHDHKPRPGVNDFLWLCRQEKPRTRTGASHCLLCTQGWIGPW